MGGPAAKRSETCFRKRRAVELSLERSLVRPYIREKTRPGTYERVHRGSRRARDARCRRRSAADAEQLGVALWHELRWDAGTGSAVAMVLADRLTRAEQQAPGRCRSHRSSRRQRKPSDLFPDGRDARARRARRKASARSRRCGSWLRKRPRFVRRRVITTLGTAHLSCADTAHGALGRISTA